MKHRAGCRAVTLAALQRRRDGSAGAELAAPARSQVDPESSPEQIFAEPKPPVGSESAPGRVSAPLRHSAAARGRTDIHTPKLKPGKSKP